MAIAIGLLKTFLELARARKTGVLDSIGDDARVRIFIEEGVVVFADEGTPGDALRQLLLREKVLTQEQHDAALEWVADLKKNGKPARLGEVLVELGMLTRQQLHAALSAQVQQKVVRALGWPTATIRFLECYGPLDLYSRFATSIEPLVPAALRLVDAARIEELFAQSLDRYPSLRSDPVPGGGTTRAETLMRIDAFSFRPPERDFVLSFDGTRSIREILGTTAPVDPSVLTASLLLTECLDLHASPLATSRRDGPSSQRRPQARPTPFRGMAPPPRTVHGDRPTPDATPGSQRPSRPSAVHMQAPVEKEQAKNVAARMRSAQDAKRAQTAVEDKPTMPALDEATPPDRARPDPRAMAEQAYQLARGYVRANRLAQALEELQRAVANHSTPEYELWIAWVELRMDAKYDKGRIEKARQAAETAIAQDPAFGFGYFVLGHIAFREGDHARASELFERANSLEPAALDDVRDVRLRPVETGRPTHSDVRPLAPLLTTPRPMPVAAPSAPESAGALRTTLVSTGAVPPPSDPGTSEPSPEIKTNDFVAPQQKLAVTAPPPTRASSPPSADALPRPTRDFARESARDLPPAEPPAPATGSVPPAKTSVPPASRPMPPRPTPSRAPAPPAASASPPPEPVVAKAPSKEVADAPEPPSRDALLPKVVVADEAPESVPMRAVPAAQSSSTLLEQQIRHDGRGSQMPSYARTLLVAATFVIAAFLLWKRFGTTAPATPDPASSASTLTAAADASALAVVDAEGAAANADVAAVVTSSPPALADAAPSAPAAAADAGAEDDAASSTAENDAGKLPPFTGLLEFPASAEGHRVYVDGKLIGIAGPPTLVGCGPRVVRIGSAGKDREIVVPCGGRLPLTYP